MNKASKASKSKGAGRASSGNVTVDLGEAIEKKIRDAGLRRTEVAGMPPSLRGRYRPGMFGHYRPWMGRFGGGRFGGAGRPWLGQEGATASRTYNIFPVEIQTVKTSSVLTGIGLGLVGNRALVRVTPMLWQNDSKLLHEGIAFVATLLPLLFKRTATTVGVAIPGLVFLGGSLVDLVMNAIGVPQKALKGTEGGARVGDASMAARQRLAAIQQKIQAPSPQRVVAKAY